MTMIVSKEDHSSKILAKLYKGISLCRLPFGGPGRVRSLSFDQKHNGDLSQTPVYLENEIFSCEAKQNHAIVFGGTWKNWGLYLPITYIHYIRLQ